MEKLRAFDGGRYIYLFGMAQEKKKNNISAFFCILVFDEMNKSFSSAKFYYFDSHLRDTLTLSHVTLILSHEYLPSFIIFFTIY